MVLVRMLNTLPTAVDGVGLKVETLVEGEVYDVIERVAERLVGRGAAEVVFPDEAEAEAEPVEEPVEAEPFAEAEAEAEAAVPAEVETPIQEAEAEVEAEPVEKKNARRRS